MSDSNSDNNKNQNPKTAPTETAIDPDSIVVEFETVNDDTIVRHAELPAEDKVKIQTFLNKLSDGLQSGKKNKELVESYLSSSEENFNVVLELAKAWKQKQGQTIEEAIEVLERNEQILKSIFGDLWDTESETNKESMKKDSKK